MTPSDILESQHRTPFAAAADAGVFGGTWSGEASDSQSDNPRSARKDWRLAPTAAVSFVIHPRRLLKAFCIGVIVLCFLGFLQACVAAANGEAAGWSFGRLFSLNYNGNLLAWFAGVALFSCAWLLGLLTALARASGDPLFKDWRTLTILVAFLSMDEVASIHQTALEPLRRMSGDSGYFEYGWIAFSLLTLAVLWKWLNPFLRCSPPATRTEFMMAFAIYFFGMLGMGLSGTLFSAPSASIGALAMVTLFNQFLEMLGILLFLRALLHHVADFAPRFHIRLERA